MSALHYVLYYILWFSYISQVGLFWFFFFALQQGISFCFVVMSSWAIGQSQTSLGNCAHNALQKTSFFFFFVPFFWHGSCIYQNNLASTVLSWCFKVTANLWQLQLFSEPAMKWKMSQSDTVPRDTASATQPPWQLQWGRQCQWRGGVWKGWANICLTDRSGERSCIPQKGSW